MIVGQPARTLLLGTVLVVTAVSAVFGFVLTQYFSVDVMSSLVFVPDDCYLDWSTKVGRHCFSDYTMVVDLGLQANPWDRYPVHLRSGLTYAYNNYPAAGMLPQLIFGILGKWLGAERLSLIGYQLALTIATLCPAVWAARGARGLERIVVFLACSVAAIPVWMVIDRGNSAGFAVPAMLVYLVALCRRRWGLVAVMVIVAALVKPQFAMLCVALFAARQWRWGTIGAGGVVLSNLAAYLLWSRNFPQTIPQSIHNSFAYGNGSYKALLATSNVSFGKALLLVPDGLKTLQTGLMPPDGYLAGPRSVLGYAVLAAVVVSVLFLGRRIPPVMAGVLLLAAASLAPALSQPYYLVFVLPVAAVMLRAPDGLPSTGIFEQFAAAGDPRRALGACVSLAVALCIAQIPLPGPPVQAGDITGQFGVTGTTGRSIVSTTVSLGPLLWLGICVVVIVSYARRPTSLTGVATRRLGDAIEARDAFQANKSVFLPTAN
ncbi:MULTISPECIES: DUF2029 domain-containing protein [Mycobacterium]|uniref:Membrane protein n=1 Tax=Mycobacterium kiyosense TaxID=2871094 RepID=A0A9P3UXS0_9MYCO|nr:MULTISPECIES: DUF2029 domain-containing protein [Mycobacterium]BDE13767.1 membrane protein [Mycobacterium sp. 20KCMC460]GLB83016.1 membrane protein [Mycobacterium kiyosense]GLB88989.1 membrane protein [Mycobacterium kiyosense]GLB94406.1 membrane protein [Mycobacterium kiyosense]GLC00913.1 membrane protein [Mycobacterium kiyosense]